MSAPNDAWPEGQSRSSLFLRALVLFWLLKIAVILDGA
jgi:hypothetical protein